MANALGWTNWPSCSRPATKSQFREFVALLSLRGTLLMLVNKKSVTEAWEDSFFDAEVELLTRKIDGSDGH